MSRPGTLSPLVATLFAAALAGAGCATPALTPSGPGRTAPTAVTGTATIHIASGTLAGLARPASSPDAQAADGPRAYVQTYNKFRIAELRLRVTGPGVSSPTTATMPWDSGGSSNPSLTGTAWTISVPAGRNRIFTLEGLDHAGHVLASIKGVASLDAGQSATVRFDYVETAIARAIESLMAPAVGDTADTAGMAGLLSTTDLTTPLRDFITTRTGYTRANNKFSTGLNPQMFRSRRLANHLRQNGLAYLQAADDGTLSSGLSGNLYFHLPPYNGVVNLYFQGKSVNMSGVGGDFGPSGKYIQAAGVAPGVYEVAAEFQDFSFTQTWTTITVEETDTVPNYNLALPVSNVTTQALTPGNVPMTSSSGGFVGATDLARDPRNANLYGVSGNTSTASSRPAATTTTTTTTTATTSR